MNGKTVYLDSSAIAKRYLVEEGTDAIDLLYRRAELASLRLAFSLWNIGEVLGAIERGRRLGELRESEARTAAWSFLNESSKLRRLGALRLVPVRGDLLAECVPLLSRRVLRQPYALQIATCKDVRAAALVSGDAKLLRAASDEELAALDPAVDGARMRSL